MKKIYINEISDKIDIDDFFLVEEKKITTAKNDTNYLYLKLKDKTGTIEAKKWDIREETFEEIDSGDIVNISGRTEKFKDKVQIIIEKIEKLEVSEKYLRYLIPKTNKNIGELTERLIDFKNLIKNEYLKKLLDKSLFDNETYGRFKISPAASKFHHACQGGLLEHTVSVTEIAIKLGEIYNVQNMDILIAGAMLHDIGKIFEYDPVTFKRTDEGRLLGHIAIGLNLISSKISKIKDFPKKIENAIKHIILSHHGEIEWGSPVQPAFLEAVIVHFSDLIDSKIQPIIENIEKEDGWKYIKNLRRKMINLEYFDEEPVENSFKKDKGEIKTIF